MHSRKLIGTILWMVLIAVFCGGVAWSKECVVLLHGLARTKRSMVALESALKTHGYQTVNQGYPSTEYTIEELASDTITKAVAMCSEVSKVHFVTHSLGGILVRYHLQANIIDNIGRVVMLGPPNKGSQVVDKLKNVPGFKLINGPAGMELGTDPRSVPSRLGPATFEVGIIAGTSTINFYLSTILPEKDDGKVTVENTRLEGMADHIILPVTHPFMMKNDEVIDQVIYFLKNGRFRRENSQTQ